MALIKRKKIDHTTNDNRDNFGLNRNSFDRFNDDNVTENLLKYNLVEELAKYLSFDDKLKFQFVSKQWMRTVFHRQNELDLKPVFLKLFEFYYRDISGNEDNIINAIECLLKTCSEIKKINVDFNCLLLSETLKISFFEKLLAKFADNCTNLQSFHLNSKISNKFNTNLWEDFGEKCGKKILNADISILTRNNCRIFLRQCPNLTSLDKITLSNLIDAKSGETLSPKLTEVKNLFVGKSVDLMHLFVIKYASTLKSLGIDLYKPEINNNCLSHVSKLTNLKTLDLTLNDNTPVDDNLKQIGINCKNLVSLRLFLKYVSNRDRSKQIMNSLKYFNSMCKLEFKTVTHNCSIGGLPNFFDNKLLLSKLFEECTHLTHLIIDSSVDDKFFTDIDKYLPQIKVLRIKTYQCFAGLNDQSLHYLAKLSELKVLEIIIKETRLEFRLEFTDDGVCHLIENCQQLKSLIFEPTPNITMKTIDKLISVAKQKPYTSFYHYFEPSIDHLGNYCEPTQSFISALHHNTLTKNLKLFVDLLKK